MYIRPLKFSYFCFATLHLLSFFGIGLILTLIFSSDYHPSPFFTSSPYKSYTYRENLGCCIERHCKDPSTSNGIFSSSVGVWPRQMTEGRLISIGWLSRATSSTPYFTEEALYVFLMWGKSFLVRLWDLNPGKVFCLTLTATSKLASNYVFSSSSST